MSKSAIEWTDDTWNPVSGCTRVSAGCDHCYAVMMTKRLEAMGKPKYAGLVNIGKGHFNGVVKCHEDALLIPLKARKPRRWFVNSMSDLFHKEVPFEFIDKVFAVMALCPHHTFQILTKRPERMAEYLDRPPLIESEREEIAIQLADAYSMERGPVLANRLEAFKRRHAVIFNGELIHADYRRPNVWLGTSVEDQSTADERIPQLLRCPAAVRFLSCEPLLGAVDFYGGDVVVCKACGSYLADDEDSDFKPCPCGCTHYVWDTPTDKASLEDIEDPSELGIHWVIVGGESGPGARPMHPDWARSLRDQCEAAGVPYFFKQWGEWASYGEIGHTAYWKAAHRGVVMPDGVLNPIKEGPATGKMAGLVDIANDGIAVAKVGKHRAGRVLDGRTWDEFPEVSA